jgi:hypothetical protein
MFIQCNSHRERDPRTRLALGALALFLSLLTVVAISKYRALGSARVLVELGFPMAEEN